MNTEHLSTTDIEREYRNLKIISLAMGASLLVYLGIGLYLLQNDLVALPAMDSQKSALFRAVFYGVALVQALLIPVLRSKIAPLLARPDTGGAGSGAHPGVVRYRVATIIALGLAESIGVFGLVLSILIHQAVDLVLLCGLAAVAMILARPTLDGLTNMVRQAEREGQT